MRYTPKKDKGAKGISFAAIVFSMLLFVTAFSNVAYKVLFEFVAFLFCIFSLELLIRFVLTEFTYVVENGNFTVIKRTGRREQTVCNLPLRTALAILETPKGREGRESLEGEYGRITVRYNFCMTLRPKKTHSILFDFNGGVAEIVFQPDEGMLTCLCNSISGDE